MPVMKIDSIKEYLGKDWTLVGECLTHALHNDIDLMNRTNESILSNSGKQLRPLLTILFARVCSPDGNVSEATIRYAAASELLHNATLLHDDVADKSDTRRGRPTIVSLMGPSISVLLGDFWLVRALSLILKDGDQDIKVMNIFSNTLGSLAEGELLQLQKSQICDTVEDEYYRIIYGKTASLFEAATISAALSVNPADEFVEAARQYSYALGIAFQIKDDILDYEGTDLVGKPLGVDILEQKITIPLLGALQNVSAQEQERVRKLVCDIPDHPEYRDEILEFVKMNGGIEYSVDRLSYFVEQAVSALEGLRDCKEKEYLKELAYFIAKRDQ